MEVLRLTVKKACAEDMGKLEQLGLITRLLPPEDLTDIAEGDIRVQTIYSTDPKYGSHKLIFVNTHLMQSRLSYHPDKEDVILVNPDGQTKPLVWVFGLHRREAFEERVRAGTLSDGDLVALEIPFNDPSASFFTVHENVPHYEVTVPGPGRSPSFWVTEPKDLPIVPIDLAGYRIELEMGRC